MDLRFVAFDLIARDATLRTLLANYAHRLDGDTAAEPRAASCFVSLGWTVGERASARAGCEVLTAQVHVSRNQPRPLEHLDRVLQRLGRALTAAGPAPCLTARCLATSGADLDSRFGTLSRSTTWAITPVPTRSEVTRPTALVPWSLWDALVAPGLPAPGRTTSGLN